MGRKSKETLPATVEQGETLPVNPNLMKEMREQAGAGIEEATRDDFAIPFLNVLQALSPQLDEDNDAYIEGAKQGTIFDSVTKDMYIGKEGILVIPCHFEKVYNEWIPREAGGGFVASYSTKKEADEMAAEENQLTDTANHYVLYFDMASDNWRQAVLSCTSTKLKQSRQWVTKLSMLKVPDGEGGQFTPPTFGTMWLLTTVKQTNQKGTFYNIDLTFHSIVKNAETYEAAKNFRAAVSSGDKVIDYQKAAEAEAGVDVTETDAY